jgi:hypothetical protein
MVFHFRRRVAFVSSFATSCVPRYTTRGGANVISIWTTSGGQPALSSPRDGANVFSIWATSGGQPAETADYHLLNCVP